MFILINTFILEWKKYQCKLYCNNGQKLTWIYSVQIIDGTKCYDNNNICVDGICLVNYML